MQCDLCIGTSGFCRNRIVLLVACALKSSQVAHSVILGSKLSHFYFILLYGRVLDAGPLLMIVTALVAIFTIGLGDSENQGGVSAYSVFNRGFERILGSVDVEALVQQHVGGVMGLAGGVGVVPEEEAVPARHRPPAARRDEDDENVARFPDDDDEDENGAPERGNSRKSGKKARRRNLEQRRELQRQRQAAMAMGFAGDEGHEEMMAMQRLLEDEIAANNGQRD